MSKARLMVINEFDRAELALSSGTEVPTLPVSNLQIYNNSRLMRVASTQFVLVGDFADITLCTGIVLWRHNWTAAATLRIELFNGPDSTGTLIYDSGIIDALPQTSWTDWDWRVDPLVNSAFVGWDTQYSQVWFAEQFVRSFRITVSDPGNTAGYLDLTRVYMGRHYEPSVNFSWGSQWAFDSKEEQIRTDDGGLFSKAAPVYRKLNFNFDYLDESDRPGLTSAIRHVRRSRDWFISLYPESGGQKELECAFACKFSTLPSISAPNFNLFSVPLAVEEC